ncbi:MAG: ATP synthase F0 subunit B [Oscillospiraceae bacterium]|nr:ATP synthase F0 subunit B [Oscillospiraceae bacterium]
MLSVDIDLLWTVINILVLCLLVKLFLLKPVHRILDERQALVDKQLSDADAAKAEADAMVAQQQEFRKNLEAEKKQAMDESSQKAMEVYNEIISNANNDAKNIIKKAETEAERQKQKILKEAQGEIRSLVLEATARVVGVSPASDSALYDQFIEKAGEANDQSNT